MKYIVIPIKVLKQVPQSTLDEMHLVPRLNVKGTKAILKLSHYDELFPLAVTIPLLDDEPIERVYEYPVYEGDELAALLSSTEWTSEDTTLADK